MWNTAIAMLAVAVTLLAAALALPKENPWTYLVLIGALVGALVFLILAFVSGYRSITGWITERARSLVILPEGLHCTYWSGAHQVEVSIQVHKESPLPYFHPTLCQAQFFAGEKIISDVINLPFRRIDAHQRNDRPTVTFHLDNIELPESPGTVCINAKIGLRDGVTRTMSRKVAVFVSSN